MADIKHVHSVESGGDPSNRSRNLQGLVSLWFAVVALVLVMMFLQFRGSTFLFAIPTAGLIAVVYGMVGLLRAHRNGSRRIEAWIGLTVGMCILVATGIVSLFVWAISRSNWQF